MKRCLLSLLPLVLATACRRPETVPALPPGTTATLAILETTDLHGTVRSFDYYRLVEDPAMGLERTATLVRQAREAFPNTLLFDNGDTLQGSALADVQATVHPPEPTEAVAVIRVMNHLGYDAATVGNHEFNFGLGFLGRALGRPLEPGAPVGPGPRFPVLCANVLSARTGQPLLEPATVLTRTFKATTPAGHAVEVPLRVGVLGLTTPSIRTWDRAHLEGKVTVAGITETAARIVPELKARGAELVVALAHGGIDGRADHPGLDNACLHLAQVPGIDAILMGHTHQTFPPRDSGTFRLPGVDAVNGTLHGVPAVMATSHGRALGVIQMQLVFDGARWRVDRGKTRVEVRPVKPEGQAAVPPDPSIAPLVAAEHARAIAHMDTPIGHTAFELTTAFADVGEASAIQVVNLMQTQVVREHVAQHRPDLAALPVIALSAPFRMGGSDPRNVTRIPPGPLTIAAAADLYPYPNTLQAVKVDGTGLRAWLEHGARRFQTLDPTRTDPQPLVGRSSSHDFDMATDPDLQYEIDLTQAPGQRIRNLRWKGRPVDANLTFLVATNSYRASGGGSFPGLDGSRTVFESPDASRELLIAWLRKAGTLDLARHGSTRSWRLAPVKTVGPVVVRAPNGLEGLARERGLPVRLLQEDDGRGWSTYTVQLDR